MIELSLLIVHDANLIEDQGVSVTDLFGFVKAQQSGLQIIGAQILHADEKWSQVAPWEQSGSCPVSSHGLVGFILGREGMTESYPRGCEMLVDTVSFVKVLSCQVVLLDQEVIGSLVKG